MARRPVVLARDRSKRGNVWIGITIESTVGGAAKTLLASLNAAALLLRPFTVVRTRGILSIRSDQVAVTETARGALGLIVASDEAIAAGAASVPGTVSNPTAPWFVYEPWVHTILFATAAAFNSPASTSVVVDSKAMRKVGQNEDVGFTMELATAPGAIIVFQGRMLVKLH